MAGVKMKQGESIDKQEAPCSSCGRIVPSYDTVHYGSIETGYRQLCGQCFSQEVAKLDGMDAFQHVNFPPIGLADCTGEIHEFHFCTRLFGPGVALDAFELRDGHPGGYRFQIIGDPNDDLLVLFGGLVERIRRALSTKHLTNGELGLQIADRIVRGQIEWDDDQDGRLPILVIDGREVTWEEFGQMLMSFEGWQFRLNILDKSEEC
jgi:hypothetical protein